MTITDLWDQRISAFLLSPSQFLATTTAESFLADLLHELRKDKANDQLKVINARTSYLWHCNLSNTAEKQTLMK